MAASAAASSLDARRGSALADPGRSVVSRFERLLRRLMVERSSRLAKPVVR